MSTMIVTYISRHPLNLSVLFSSCIQAPHESDWVGIYPVGVNSVPSASEGRWMYVPTALKGKIEFPAAVSGIFHTTSC